MLRSSRYNHNRVGRGGISRFARRRRIPSLFTGAVLLALNEADADRNADGALQLSELIDAGDFVIAPAGTRAAPSPPADD